MPRDDWGRLAEVRAEDVGRRIRPRIERGQPVEDPSMMRVLPGANVLIGALPSLTRRGATMTGVVGGEDDTVPVGEDVPSYVAGPHSVAPAVAEAPPPRPCSVGRP